MQKYTGVTDIFGFKWALSVEKKYCPIYLISHGEMNNGPNFISMSNIFLNHFSVTLGRIKDPNCAILGSCNNTAIQQIYAYGCNRAVIVDDFKTWDTLCRLKNVFNECGQKIKLIICTIYPDPYCPII